MTILASGSSGNSTLIETRRTKFLIDAGVSARELSRRLASAGRHIDQIDLILVSHEHDDHIRGLAVLSRHHRLTVASSAGTLALLRSRLSPDAELFELRAGVPFRFADVEVVPIPLAHDAVEPLGFRVSVGSTSLAHLTDLGRITGSVIASTAGVDALVIESNHDEDLVRDGPYPWSLKQRLLGGLGHLSNDSVAQYLALAELENLKLLCLAHLSRSNNRPALARQSAETALQVRGLSPILWTARHDQASASEPLGQRLESPGSITRSGATQMVFPFPRWPNSTERRRTTPGSSPPGSRWTVDDEP